MLRDDTLPYTSNRKARKKILQEILAIEEDELGVSRIPSPTEQASRAREQHAYALRISQPLRQPTQHFTDYLRAPRTLRGKGNRSLDVLFSANSDGTFWLYGSMKVSHATLGPYVTSLKQPPTKEELLRKSPIGSAIKKQIDALMAVAATKERSGLIFDLVSTSKIIANGAPHEVGALIYDYIEEAHCDKTGLKFVFVGITDNVNCCAARDVFCRDDIVAGQYVGDTKRPFDALDNVHMYTVFPGHRLHPFTKSSNPTASITASTVNTSGPAGRGSAILNADASIDRSRKSPSPPRSTSAVPSRSQLSRQASHRNGVGEQNRRPQTSAESTSGGDKGTRGASFFLTQ